eukprot:90985-Pelagomonas_calceolata.AAC.1
MDSLSAEHTPKTEQTPKTGQPQAQRVHREGHKDIKNGAGRRTSAAAQVRGSKYINQGWVWLFACLGVTDRVNMR